jgi:hypothetical protein
LASPLNALFLSLDIKVMFTIIEKKSSSKENSKKFTMALITKGVDTHKFCGVIKLPKDALSIQKEFRNEWE